MVTGEELSVVGSTWYYDHRIYGIVRHQFKTSADERLAMESIIVSNSIRQRNGRRIGM